MTSVFNRILILFLLSSSLVYAEEENKEEVQGIPQMTAKERQSMGIVTTPVDSQRLTGELIAPGEVTLNAYRSSQVTSRISSQIIRRHARMGDVVKTGQKLLTLSSVDMPKLRDNCWLLIANGEG